MWFVFAFLSAVFYSFRGALEKLLVARVNRYVLGFGIRIFALPFFIIPFIIKPDLFVPLSELPWEFWAVVLVVSFVNVPLEAYFYYKSIKHEEISLALPILSLAPVFTIFFAMAFLGEYPSIIGALGVIVILFGVYALKIDHARYGLLEPLHHLRKNRSVQMMLIVAISLGIAAVFDKIGVTTSNAYMYALINYMLMSTALFIFAAVKARQHLGQLWAHARDFLVIGVVVASYTLLYNLALAIGNTSYVIAIRNASLLITIILGVLWLKEKDLRTKLFAGAIIVAGLICLKVFG